MTRIIPVALALTLSAAPAFAVNHSSANPSTATGEKTVRGSGTQPGESTSGRSYSTSSSGTSMEPRSAAGGDSRPDDLVGSSDTSLGSTSDSGGPSKSAVESQQYNTATGGRQPSGAVSDRSGQNVSSSEQSADAGKASDPYAANKKKKKKKQ